MLLFDFTSADPNVVPRIRKHPDPIPQVFSIVGGAGDERGRKTEVFLGLGIVSAPDSQVDRLPVPQFALLINFPVVNYVILKDRQWCGIHEQVVPLLGCELGDRRVPQGSFASAFEVNLGIVFLTPLLTIVLEPPIKVRVRMGPLDDLEFVLARTGTTWKDDIGAHSGC